MGQARRAQPTTLLRSVVPYAVPFPKRIPCVFTDESAAEALRVAEQSIGRPTVGRLDPLHRAQWLIFIGEIPLPCAPAALVSGRVQMIFSQPELSVGSPERTMLFVSVTHGSEIELMYTLCATARLVRRGSTGRRRHCAARFGAVAGTAAALALASPRRPNSSAEFRPATRELLRLAAETVRCWRRQPGGGLEELVHVQHRAAGRARGRRNLPKAGFSA